MSNLRERLHNRALCETLASGTKRSEGRLTSFPSKAQRTGAERNRNCPQGGLRITPIMRVVDSRGIRLGPFVPGVRSTVRASRGFGRG